MLASHDDGPVDHEKSYRGLSLRAFLHRARLRAILGTLRHAALGASGRLADFGCSNGFILSELRAKRFPYPGWELWGFDHASPYIDAARLRGIAGARFEPFDLDLPEDRPAAEFDLVLCLETLEHTGNYRIGLDKLARATRPGGYLLVSVPNERGLPGVLKFFGRKVLMRKSYENFFRGRPQGPYVRALLGGEDLEPFRDPPRHGWGDHLGFDIRRFEAFLFAELLAAGTFEMILRRRPALGFGRLYLFRRKGLSAAAQTAGASSSPGKS
jgi:SAM-dependent methyltransferase